MTEPVFYDTVNFLYHSIMDRMPRELQERDISSAFILGVLGSYGAVRFAQFVSKLKLVAEGNPFYEEFLPKLEKICLVSMVAVPLMYANADPEGVKEIINQHPVYTSGMAGLWLGSVAGALQDLHKRKLEEMV